MAPTEYLYNWTWSGYNPIAVGWEACAPKHSFGPASREFYVIHYVLSGKGTMTARGQTHHISAGTMFAFSPYETVYYEADQSDPWQYVWINFIINGQVPYRFNNLVEYQPDLKDIFISIMEYADHKHTGREFVSNCMWKIASRLSSSILEDSLIVEKALNYISVNYASPNLSVAEIANTLVVKQSRLSKLFMQKKNMTTGEYLLRYRLRKACKYIREQNLSPTVAAMMVGYNNYANFSKIFKKYYGVSPKQYQENPNSTPPPPRG